ncbi:MAG: hypothetical protein QXU75_06495 [Candidatus Methanomethylicaceae archaeon]
MGPDILVGGVEVVGPYVCKRPAVSEELNTTTVDVRLPRVERQPYQLRIKPPLLLW